MNTSFISVYITNAPYSSLTTYECGSIEHKTFCNPFTSLKSHYTKQMLIPGVTLAQVLNWCWLLFCLRVLRTTFMQSSAWLRTQWDLQPLDQMIYTLCTLESKCWHVNYWCITGCVLSLWLMCVSIASQDSGDKQHRCWREAGALRWCCICKQRSLCRHHTGHGNADRRSGVFVLTY